MDIFEYDDCRAVLADWLDAHPRVSQRAFIRRIGSKDPSVVRRILSGDRAIGPAQVEPMIRAFELDDDGAKCFRLLVRIAHRRRADDPAAAAAELAGLRAAVSARRLRDPTAYSSWARVAVAELAAISGFEADPVRVAASFDPPLAPEVAADALAHHAGRPAETRATPTRVRHREVFGYYRGIHERTAHAIDRLEREPSAVEESLFLGLTFAANAESTAVLRARLVEVQRELLGLAAAAGPADRVVQINLQLFPLTR
jgi:hypothetical protein